MLSLFKKLTRLILPEPKIWEIKNKQNIPSMEWSLLNIKKLGFNPEFAVDVGAFEGEWSTMFKKIFPLAKILMIEGQYEKENILKGISNTLPDTCYHIGLLGSQNGKDVVFHVNATVSSVLEEYKLNDFKRETRKLETLDIAISKLNYNLPPPDFIKLDVQGYELEVLKGASETLTHVQFVLCEVSLIEINAGSPLIAEVIKFLDDKGFITYDICSFIRRPLDRALWQTDILFIRKTHPIIQNKYWN
ncbi:MAG: methyltransferase FkbM family [Mucilaginibacter sp.]|nr:methyltransferase FkbM family [Mucilaginibacter sp.]